jgi:hypothetical protein
MFQRMNEIAVRFYSGYKGGETPRSLVIGGREYPVDVVISKRRCSDKETRKSFEIFHCRVAGKAVWIQKDESGECHLLPSSDLSFLAGE